METICQRETRRLLSYIAKSPTAYHAVAEAAASLDGAGFQRVSEAEPGFFGPGNYYLVRGGSSIIAFRVPEKPFQSAMIVASHSDSPMFKLKDRYESEAFGKYLRLNTEAYGGFSYSSWFDRPLSVAGRVIVREGDEFRSVNVNVDRNLCVIPNVCIHFMRNVNDGMKINPAVDTLPLLTSADNKGGLARIIAEAAGTVPEKIAGSDLFVYNRMAGTLWGLDGEFFSAPRIDNLACAWCSLSGFLDAPERDTLRMWCVFDNEETGSATKAGAGSSLLRDVMEKIARDNSLELPALLARSMMVSADNGHARHPNHPELSDGDNAPHLNDGVVIKHNAAQRYATDGASRALFDAVCRKAGVPVQTFANRSDIHGGSTLGSISSTKVPLLTVDIGMAQLAMHSAYETAGCRDVEYMLRAMTAFYGAELRGNGDGLWSLT